MFRANLALFLACGLLTTAQTPTSTKAAGAKPSSVESKYQMSGAYTHDNLSVFLIHGRGGVNPAVTKYLSLKDAMEQKKVVVHETRQVNELAVENVSNQPVFIQGGDIVKGGQQDRVISNDFVLPPRSGRLPVAAFCVELGRWHQRGSESASMFGSSSEMVASQPVKFAAIAMWNQSSVWSEIERLQGTLARAVGLGEGVRAKQSPSSLILTLESPPLEQAVRGYVDALSGVANGKGDVIGAVFAVNGEVNSADVYLSPELFASMWPKLLKASAVEAVRLRQSRTRTSAGTPAGTAVGTPVVEAFLRDAERGTESVTDVDRRVKLVKRETDRQVFIESQEGGTWVHRGYIKK